MTSINPGSPSADLPSTRSKTSERQLAAVDLCRDAFSGTTRIRERAQVYLPQGPGERPENYQTRLKRSVFPSFFRRTVEGLAGFVFAKDPVLGNDVPITIKKHWENIDNAGTHGDVFSRDLLNDALIAGHAAILIDFPKTGGVQDGVAEAKAIRPYWIPIKKEDIISWRTTLEEGRTILTQLVLKECHVIPNGRFGEKVQELYRIFDRRRRVLEDGEELLVVSFELVEIKDDGLVVIDKGIYLNQNEIPVVEVPTNGRLGVFESMPPLLDVAHLNVAYYQQASDHAYALYMSAVPLLVRIGAINGDQTGSTALVAGPNAAIDLPINGDLRYVTPDSSALDAASRAMQDTISNIGSLGLAMLAPQKRSAETAEAKRLDKAGSDSALAVTARGLQDALERALEIHARYLRLEDGGSITINRDFGEGLMEPAVLNGIAALVREGFPHRIALEMMQLGGRIPEDADIDLLEAEWVGGQNAVKQIEQDNFLLNGPMAA